jgi:type IV conjugative transfer system coupling protein TraD
MQINNLTRGGQVFAHDVRMLMQVLKTTLLISSCLSLITTYFFVLADIDLFKLYVWLVHWWAHIKLNIGALFYKNPNVIEISFYNWWHQSHWSHQWHWPHQSYWQTWPALQFIQQPFVQQLNQQLLNIITSPSFYLQLILLPVLSAIAVLSFFYYKGYRVRQNTHAKGIKLVDLKTLKRQLKSRRLLGDLHLDGAPLAKDRETTHMLIAGTTGSGKSNCFNHLLPQIRKRQQKAIILDLTGDFVKRYFDPSQDILLNPIEPGGQVWDLWADADNTFDYQAMAESFIGTAGQNHDLFWLESAKACLAASFEKLSPTRNIEQVLYYLTRAPLPEFAEFLQDTDAAAFADPKGERTTASIRAVLTAKIQSLKVLQNQPAEFSIKRWVQDEAESGWLFLAATPAERELMCPMIAAQISTAIKSLMQLDPDSQRRCWFILDELPALNKLAALPLLLAEGRKYGACAVAGIQDFAQLDLSYGVKQAQTILNQLNTKVIFRFTDPNGCQLAAKMLGEMEESETKENISYGANTMRDGVSVVSNTNRRFTVMPTQIATLQNLECYLRLPENLPITIHKLKYLKG